MPAGPCGITVDPIESNFLWAAHRVEKGVLTIMIRKTEGARPNIKDVFID